MASNSFACLCYNVIKWKSCIGPRFLETSLTRNFKVREALLWVDKTFSSVILVQLLISQRMTLCNWPRPCHWETAEWGLARASGPRGTTEAFLLSVQPVPTFHTSLKPRLLLQEALCAEAHLTPHALLTLRAPVVPSELSLRRFSGYLVFMFSETSAPPGTDHLLFWGAPHLLSPCAPHQGSDPSNLGLSCSPPVGVRWGPP